MNNDHHDNNHTRGLPFPHNFNIGTTIQNVFRNINNAFATNHDSGHTDDSQVNIPPLESLNSVGGIHGNPTDTTAHASSRPAAPVSSVPSTSPSDASIPSQSQPESQPDDEEDFMPELQSISDSSSDESDADLATQDSLPSIHVHPVSNGRGGVRIGDEGNLPPLEPIAGTRRARVDDDGDDARDRRHPSERVSGPPPQRDAGSQTAEQQQPPQFPQGFFVPLFGHGPPGGNHPAGDAPPERVHTGEATADPSPAGNNSTPGHAPRGIPILTAGFTLTIPLFGSPPAGNRPAPAAGAQGGAPGAFGMDAATREELLASFAAFFQEFQALDEGREDPERAKKLVDGLEVVPFGLVKRLERVGGAPGGHIGDSTSEGMSGCAICWDTLLDAEGDSFSGQQLAGSTEAPQSSSTDEDHDEVHTQRDAMDVDAPLDSTSDSEPGTSDATPSSPEEVKIISLPCAHVFHASCLLPWFTRAKQATCPTCRFNIDPENLTYTPRPRRPFNRPGPPRPDNANLNPPATNPQAAPEVPSEGTATGTRTADATAPPVDFATTNADDHPETPQVPPGPTGASPAGQAGVPPPGFNPFTFAPGIPIFSFPAIQIPLRQAPDNQGGVDVLTIGLDMFVGGPPPQGRRGDHRNDAEDDGVDDANNDEAGADAAGENGAPNPNGLAQDLHSLIEGLLRTTRNIIPQVINAQGGPVPPQAPTPDAPLPDGAQPQPQTRPASETTGPQSGPPPTGGPRAVPGFPFLPNMFRPTRPMPPRREPKAWSVPAAPGPSLRQRVEQREREQGLRCSDTSCGVGPSDDDPYPDPSASSTKQLSIHPLPDRDNHGRESVCPHAFHPACLVSAERVAGWGGEDKTQPLVEVSCPLCRAVGCVTRDEWESGVSAL